ncbi:biopolymer transporter ExbD [Saccharicrinis aurantiacus]|uniref:biopolymer transporter ExbD n=1 Tax=Saccharicrinis aurantiacus TaxID=1849719 RepID=UPI0024907B12|nr:biopolymer transporter ExbD [Saccharicrinis aurantiacus]
MSKKYYCYLVSYFVVLVVCTSWTDRNLFTVWVKSGDIILVKGEERKLSDLKELTKEYIANPNNESWLPSKRSKRVHFFGDTQVSIAVVSIQTDRDVTYGFYIDVQNELEKAYAELREELAQKKFGTTYGSLSSKKQKAINTVFPIRISEAEPNWVRGKDGELRRNSSWYY